LRAATSQNAVSEMHSSGVWPYKPTIFSEDDYATASVTDCPYPDFTPTSPVIQILKSPRHVHTKLHFQKRKILSVMTALLNVNS